jgi:hypothetical protein
MPARPDGTRAARASRIKLQAREGVEPKRGARVLTPEKLLKKRLEHGQVSPDVVANRPAELGCKAGANT